MSVMMKRSEKNKAFPLECPYGCCTPVYGKNVKNVRRSVKRSEKQKWKREVNA